MTLRHLVAGVALMLVVAAIVGGLFIVGSPSRERARRLDEERTTALRGLMGSLDMYWKLRGRLPASLDELIDPRLGTVSKDPETGQQYGYRVLSEKTYQLCADFAREGDDQFNPFWNHEAGRHCFDIDVNDPSR